MQKTYSRINWQNYPSENTPLNESNLNRMDSAINTIDDRVIALDTDKASAQVVGSLVANIAVDDATGEITVTKQNGSSVTVPTTLNKIAINFRYDYATQNIILTLNDGTEVPIDISSLIQNNEFANTATIGIDVSAAGIVTAHIINGSITDEMLRTDYLADIRVAMARAENAQAYAEDNSYDSEAWAKGTRASQPVAPGVDGYNDNSKYYKNRSEAWAAGTINRVSVESTDECYHNNSKYYSQISQSLKDDTTAIKNQAAELLDAATQRLTGLNLMINYSDGCLYYDINSGIRLQIDQTTGNLLYEVVT